VPDPAAAEGGEENVAKAFLDSYGRLRNRISVFVNLRFDALDRLSLQNRLNAIGAGE
jgi:hypothetical protein